MRTDGYSRFSIIFHWVGAVLVIALFFTHEGDRGSLEYSIHVGGGALVGVLLIWRVLHRIGKGSTTSPDQAWYFNLVSKLVMFGLLLAIFTVVITGYLVPWSLGQSIDVFGIFNLPSPMSRDRGLHEIIEELHEISGKAFIPLLILHIGGALKHKFIDRDAIANRMVKSVPGGR